MSVLRLLSYGGINAIIGTMRRSDSPRPIDTSSLLRLAASSPVAGSNRGVSWVAAHSVHTCHGLRPRGATRPGRCVSTGHGLVFRVDFHHFNSVVLSQLLISGLNPFNLSACGLHACVLRLKYRITPVPPRISYPAAASLPGRDLHPLEYATLPSRTKIAFRFLAFTDRIARQSPTHYDCRIHSCAPDNSVSVPACPYNPENSGCYGYIQSSSPDSDALPFSSCCCSSR
jgi:hypothetical protein